MKYVNSLKYINSFERAGSLSEISQKRIRELCLALGRINIGSGSIFLPSGAAGHATAIMLESVVSSAGYKVGRITSVGGYDSRSVVYLDGAIPDIEAYNRAVAAIKAVVIQNTDEVYFKEEITFTLALLICRMHGCEYVIFEGTSAEDHSLDAICAPYDLVVIPTALNGDNSTVGYACDAIRRGTREVISGNQKKNAYDAISNACVTSGVRLNFTSKQGFEVESRSSIKQGFSYCGRGGYTVKSPSLLQGDCAMLVIESALAIRRDGVKLPWASISSGLASASGAGCFETVSASPLVIVDCAKTDSELELLIATMDEVFGRGRPEKFALCLPYGAQELARAFGERVCDVIVVGETEETSCDGEVFCRDAGEAAKRVVSLMREGRDALCIGSCEHATEMKCEIIKRMGL